MMATLTTEQIQEIADKLGYGFRCLWHEKTGELFVIPDQVRNPDLYHELFDKDVEQIENNLDDYIEIEQPTASESYVIMANFTDQLVDNSKLKNQLIAALNKKNPFSQFKFVVDNSGVYRKKWFDYKNAQLKLWIIDKFNEATGADRESGTN